MNKMIYIPMLLLLASCLNASQEQQTKAVDAPRETNNQIAMEADSGLMEAEGDSEDDADCIFDQTTQTDDFLKGISELENYKWNAEEKEATVILETNDTLLISRGGRSHFGVSAEFRLRNDSTDYSDWEAVYERVLWISEVLSSEFAHEEIKNALKASEIEVNNDHTFFTNQYLQDNNYEIYRSIEPDRSLIILSYYIN